MEGKQNNINLKKLKTNECKVEHINNIYTNVFNIETDKRVKRYEHMLYRFQKVFGDEPQYYIRAPSIVNLFGDESHNGSGFNKLSFPIEQDILIAVKKNKNKIVKVEHMQSTLYPAQTFDIDQNQPFKDINTNQFNEQQQIVHSNNSTVLQNLFLCGYKAALTGVDTQSLTGIDMLIDFNFQQNSSIGFSNAYVIAVAFSVLSMNEHVKPNFDTLMFLLQKYKKMVTNMSTDLLGNNQLISLVSLKQRQLNTFEGQENIIKMASFPDIDKKPGNNMVFILADSLTEKVKVMSSGKRKEMRQCEIRMGIQLLLHNIDANKGDQNFTTIKQLQEFLSLTTEEMKEYVMQNMEDITYTLQQVEDILKVPAQTYCSDISNIDQALSPTSEYSPRKRMLHYLSEEIKVQNILKLLQNREEGQTRPQEENQNIWKIIGELMNESYQNQKDLLQCTSSNIEKLRDLMMQLGCKAAKLLGQGWEGIVIGLISEDKAQKTIEFLSEEYYLKKENKLSITDDLDQYIYQTYPCVGAKILDPQFEIWFA